MNRLTRLMLFAMGAVVFCDARAGAQRGSSADPALARRIQFGATLFEVPDSLRRSGMPAGAFVASVIEGSSAATAGVRPGDVIVRIAADTIESVANALHALRPLAVGQTIAVTMIRGAHPITLRFRGQERPRETSQDFALEYRAVAARGGIHRVLLTHPSDDARHPTVLIIGGIGCYSIDQASGQNAYRDLAYHLTRHGYTVVRVEKLGVGDSEGGSCLETDFGTELDGYRRALVALHQYSAVDTAHVFLFGHSIGGIEAPLLAGERADDHVAGVAVLSTTGVAWYEYELANLRRQLRLQDLSPDSVEQAMRLKTICTFDLLEEKQSRASIVAREPACAPYLAYPASDAYMQSVIEYPPARVWRGVHAPALVMYGSSDFITSRSEHVMLTDDINAMHPGSAMYAEIADLDHYLSREASQQASLRDSTPGLARPYYGATLEPVLDQWLDSLSRKT
ncbi:MAG TPA: alpha/beta fold hydrolase [Gemmatimonadaceae bacterium]|nr:alpha/beta fold hydrolase [Gemmatimonadaceae bacterium]